MSGYHNELDKLSEYPHISIKKTFNPEELDTHIQLLMHDA